MERIKKYEPLWGKWTVKRKIGEGSFGAVYEVESEKFGNKSSCAVKLISFKNAEMFQGVNRAETLSPGEFEQLKIKEARKNVREAVLMDKLQGRDHIVNIHDYDIFPGEGTTDVIIRMELLQNLNEYIELHKTNSENELKELVIKIGTDIGKALEECEEEKIVHRDIKPDNIFVNKNNTFKLGDFGLSRKMSKSASFSLRKEKGTPLYMAPESFGWGSKTDYLSDIYSLGIVMYQLLNDGNIPFALDMESYDEIYGAIGKRADGEELPLPKHDQGELWKVIQKACQFKKEDRYQSAQEMLKDLNKLKSKRQEKNNSNENEKVQKNKEIVLAAQVGDTIIFGSYPQDDQFSTKEKIEWIILDRKKDKVLLISKYILDVKPYHKTFTDVTWGASDIRKWLNDEFYNIAFDYSEQKKIAYTFTKVKKKSGNAGNNVSSTADKIFFLDKEEAEKFFTVDAERQAEATNYVKRQGIYVNERTEQSPWWLRSSGYDTYNMANVDEYGKIYSYGSDIVNENIGVRPALWMSLEF